MINNKILFITVLVLCIGRGLAQIQAGFWSYIPWKFGRCVVPPIKQNFDIDKFFTGRWYQQSSFGNFLFQGGGICPTTEYNIDDGGQIQELDYHFEQLLMKYITVRGNSYTQFIRDGQGYLPITYSLLGGLLTYEAPMYIVDTDYDNWALIYSCKQQLFFKAEMSWVVSRERTGWEATEETNSTITNAGLDLNDYIPAVNIGCGPNEPSF